MKSHRCVKPKNQCIGYIALHRKSGLPPTFAVGQRVSRPSAEPPWIVIHEEVEDAAPLRWPCTLFKAQAHLVLSPQNHRGRYTRCQEIEAIEMVDTRHLFGKHGDKVVEILDRILLLTENEAEALAKTRDEKSEGFYGLAFSRWSQKEGPTNYRGVIMAQGPDHYGSPIAKGFSLISITVDDRAETLTAGKAKRIDDEGEIYWAPPWQNAKLALFEAAMALGAPQFVEEHEAEVMLRPYRALIMN